MNPGVFLFAFPSTLERDRVLEAGPWTFDNRPLVLKPWSPDESYSLESVASLPVWVRFPGLGPHLMKPNALSLIASSVGRPIRTDGFTASSEKLAYARVFIEIFAEQEFKTAVAIRGPNGVSVIQKIEYEWQPPRCSHCLSFGHRIAQCKLPQIDLDPEEEENDQVPLEIAAVLSPSCLNAGPSAGNIGQSPLSLEEGEAGPVIEDNGSIHNSQEANGRKDVSGPLPMLNTGLQNALDPTSSKTDAEPNVKDVCSEASPQSSDQFSDGECNGPFIEVKRKSRKSKKGKADSFDSDMSKSLMRLTKEIMNKNSNNRKVAGKGKGGSYKASSKAR